MKIKFKGLTSFLLALLIALFSAGYQPMEADAVSLFGRGNNMFADRKAHDVGDIVTILISETTSTSTNKNTSNGKSGEQEVTAGTGILRMLMGGSASQSDKFSASGSTSNTNKVSARLTVTIVDVMDNGTLVIEGKQSIWQNNNEEKITLKGIIRPEDISVNNTIPSNKIADATIKFDGKGPLNNKQRQGILTQIFNILF